MEPPKKILMKRIEDLEPNIDFELERYTSRTGDFVRFNNDARKHYLDLGHSTEALWTANFRDLNASIIRMSTLAENGRISSQIVDDEIKCCSKNGKALANTREQTHHLTPQPSSFHILAKRQRRRLITTIK